VLREYFVHQLNYSLQLNLIFFLTPRSHYLFAATNIRYQITGGNIGNAFAVQNTTGVIYVASPLDYETRPRVSSRLLWDFHNCWKSGFCYKTSL